MSNKLRFPLVVVLAFLLLAPCLFAGGKKEGEQAQAGKRWEQPIVIGWTPPDITGVFKTATNFFEAAAKDGNSKGFKIQIITQSPASHTAFADQVAIIEDYIQRGVDVIAISPIEVEVIKPALAKANERGIPVVIVNLLEPIADVEVASYIGFDNTVGAMVTAYAVLDYFGGPGVLGAGRKVEVAADQYLDLAFWEQLYGSLPAEEKDGIRATGAIIEGVAGGFFSTARVNGFHKVLDAYPGIRITGVPIAADWNREKGIKATEDILQANPSGLDFIWAASNEMGLGAMLTCESAGRLQLAGEPHEPGGREGGRVHQRRDPRIGRPHRRGEDHRGDDPRVRRLGLVRNGVRGPAGHRAGGAEDLRHPPAHRLAGQRLALLSGPRPAAHRLGTDQAGEQVRPLS